jgi:hypothetical protein
MIVGFPARTKHQYEMALKFDEDAQRTKTPPPRVRQKAMEKDDLSLLRGDLLAMSI